MVSKHDGSRRAHQAPSHYGTRAHSDLWLPDKRRPGAQVDIRRGMSNHEQDRGSAFDAAVADRLGRPGDRAGWDPPLVLLALRRR